MSLNQYSRVRQKRTIVSGQTPTIPPSNDHTDGTWVDTDLYPGEFYMNMGDLNGFVGLSGGTGQFIFTTGTTTSLLNLEQDETRSGTQNSKSIDIYVNTNNVAIEFGGQQFGAPPASYETPEILNEYYVLQETILAGNTLPNWNLTTIFGGSSPTAYEVECYGVGVDLSNAEGMSFVIGGEGNGGAGWNYRQSCFIFDGTDYISFGPPPWSDDPATSSCDAGLAVANIGATSLEPNPSNSTEIWLYMAPPYLTNTPVTNDTKVRVVLQIRKLPI